MPGDFVKLFTNGPYGIVLSTLDPGDDAIPYIPARSYTTCGRARQGDQNYIIFADGKLYRVSHDCGFYITPVSSIGAAYDV